MNRNLFTNILAFLLSLSGMAITTTAAVEETPAAEPNAKLHERGKPLFSQGVVWRRQEHGCGEHRGCWGMVTATDGTILAFAEGRVPKKQYGQWGDTHPMSVVCKRGTPKQDGSVAWSDSVVIEDRANALGWGRSDRKRLMDPDRDGTGWGNPTPVVDRTTGRVFVFY